LRDITQAGTHLLALINDILDLAKVEAGRLEMQPEAFSLNQAIAALLSTLRPLAEAKGLSLQVEPPGDGLMTTDSARLRQVLYNLLSNAIKFTPAGGRVTVRWEWLPEVDLEAAAVPVDQAAAMRIAVQDTGIGIAPEDQDLIWEDFRQVRTGTMKSHDGAGLGLALTQRLVQLLGGLIRVDSTPGEGSTFTTVLPRQLPPQMAAEIEEVPTGACQGAGIRPRWHANSDEW
jgi:signal transduction histidine kinase